MHIAPCLPLTPAAARPLKARCATRHWRRLFLEWKSSSAPGCHADRPSGFLRQRIAIFYGRPGSANAGWAATKAPAARTWTTTRARLNSTGSRSWARPERPAARTPGTWRQLSSMANVNRTGSSPTGPTHTGSRWNKPRFAPADIQVTNGRCPHGAALSGPSRAGSGRGRWGAQTGRQQDKSCVSPPQQVVVCTSFFGETVRPYRAIWETLGLSDAGHV